MVQVLMNSEAPGFERQQHRGEFEKPQEEPECGLFWSLRSRVDHRCVHQGTKMTKSSESSELTVLNKDKEQIF